MHYTDQTEVIGGLRYSTETAILIADDEEWDGSNWERHGRNTFLFRTPNGRYFTASRSMWQGEPGQTIRPVSETEAVDLWESLPERYVEFEEAFPALEVVEA